ncbi:MAG: NAD(P)/FAD-dependent oxidoreductase [Planctomycetes bacterium]|nr:NAD(P)/FAD-dependent oxidoreductase [Planctomycetota bacterium]
MTTFDAAVIGGGPAGCLAATYLARGGLSVALIEKRSTPHHKVCGEFISGEGVPLLLDADVSLAQATHISGMRLHGPTRSCEAPLPTAARGLSRLLMDELLLEAAQNSGVKLIRGERAKTLKKADSVFHVGGIAARRVVCATGKAEFKPVQTRAGRDSGMVGFKVHLRLAAKALGCLRQHVDLFVFESGYGGLAPVEDGLANLCFLMEREAIANVQGEWPRVARWLSNACEGLAGYLDNAEPAFWPMASVANVPYGFVRETAVADDIYCVGDQLAVIPSLTGEGMTIAMQTGKRAAECILAGVGATEFQHDMAAVVRPRVELGFLVHRLFKSPRLSDLGTQLVNRWPRLIDYIFRHTRTPAV